MIFMKFCVRAWALVVHGQWKSGTSPRLTVFNTCNANLPKLDIIEFCCTL
jgi:hypothetical protein